MSSTRSELRPLRRLSIAGIALAVMTSLVVLATPAIGADGDLVPNFTTIDLGDIRADSSGRSKSRNLVSLENQGSTDITVSSISEGSSQFSVQSGLGLPVTLSAGEKMDFWVEFAPTSAGSHGATLSIVNTGNVSPLEITLAGRGVSTDIWYRVNSGGNFRQGTVDWVRDSPTVPSPYLNATDIGNAVRPPNGDPLTRHSSLPSTAPTELGDTHRHDPPGGDEMSWNFPADSGTYEVRLYFAEIENFVAGDRVFDVILEGATVLQNFDVVAEVGQDSLMMRSFLVSNTGGNIDLDFSREVQNPMISAIEIIKRTGAPGITITPDPIELKAPLNGSDSQTVTITNTGISDGDGPALEISSINLTGADAGDFTSDYVDTNPILQDGESLDFEISYNGEANPSASDATLQVVVANAASNVTASITGQSFSSLSSLAASPASLGFGDVNVGASKSLTLTLTNQGAAGDSDITLSLSLSGGGADEYGFSSDKTTISPGESANVTVSFEPSSTGTFGASLQVTHDGSNSPTTIGLTGKGVSTSSFIDIGDSIFQTEINWLAATGITKGCNPPTNDRFCPTDNVTRGQMAAFLHRALDDILTPGAPVEFIDDNGSTFEADIEWLGATGVTRGCNPPINDEFCPNNNVTRGQMAAFLHRALEDVLTPGPTTDFIDDNGSTFEADIEWLAATGVTKGCNPPANDRFCPEDPVTREQMAAFLYRALANG